MKVRAIRVAEFGRFREPTAVEDLSEQLNLLVGPNEAGKSTLFKALEFAFFHRHRTTRQDLAEARPYSGGSPLVEVDFDLSDRSFRLRKRYLASPSAELFCRTTGSVARGNDAEEELQKLLAEAGVAGGRSFLWPRQGELLTNRELEPASRDVLRAAVDREISRAAGGEALRRVRARVAEALGELVTSKQQKPRGHYQAVLDRAATVAISLERARADFGAAESLFDRLAEIDAELRKHADPSARALIQKRLSDAQNHLRIAQEARGERSAAQLSLAEAQATHRAARSALDRLDEALAEVDRLEQAQSECESEAGEIAKRCEAAQAEVDAAEAGHVAARDGMAVAEGAVRRAAAMVRHRELSDRAERAKSAIARSQELHERAIELRVDPQAVREARALAGRIAEGEVRLEAASAAVMVQYEPGTTTRIRSEGRELQTGERLLARERLVLDIPGIGRIEIEPGASRDRESIEADLARDRANLADILGAAAVSDVAELEARHELARSVAADLETARAEAKAIAPEGLGALEAMRDAAAADVDEAFDPDAALPDREQLAAVRAQRRTELLSAEATLRSCVTHHSDLKQRAAALQARSGERQLRLAALAALLPPDEQRAPQREAAAMAAERADRALDDALRLERLATSRAPDDEAMQRFQANVAEAIAACQQSERTIAALERDRGRVDGELAARRREDVAARVAVLEAEAERARAEREDIEEEVRALQLLEAELAAQEERLRDGYLVPVLTRLRPYVEAVFPDGTLTLGADYAVQGLQRGTQAEALVRLSDGTREQIAVLVRLAFARLLADQGMAMPLVLDDALVYSDDGRIRDMYRAVEQGARSHQVIVLTCREQAFSELRGNRVEMKPWQLVSA